MRRPPPQLTALLLSLSIGCGGGAATTDIPGDCQPEL